MKHKDIDRIWSRSLVLTRRGFEGRWRFSRSRTDLPRWKLRNVATTNPVFGTNARKAMQCAKCNGIGRRCNGWRQNASKSEEMRRRELKRGREWGREEGREGGGAATSEKSHWMRRGSTRWPRVVGRIDGAHRAVIINGQDEPTYPWWPYVPTSSPSRGCPFDMCR
jgi:hypothetical protein